MKYEQLKVHLTDEVARSKVIKSELELADNRLKLEILKAKEDVEREWKYKIELSE
jgi:hypothetical protein